MACTWETWKTCLMKAIQRFVKERGADMLNEAKRYIEECDYDGLMDWAFNNDDSSSTGEVLKSVADAYEYLIGKGYGIAANNLGSMYYCGRYFKEDVDKAVHYYKIACDMGIPMAFGNLGCCFYYGERKDYCKAYKVFSEGAFLFNDIECLYMLGEMYQYGRYAKKHLEKARHLYFKALDCIDSNNERDYNCIGEIHYRIGRFLIEESNDIKAGLKHLHVALGFLYEKIDDDKFVKSNIEKAKVLVAKAEDFLNVEKSEFFA